MQIRATSEPTVVTSALTVHSVVIFSTFLFEIHKDQDCSRQRKQTEKPSERPSHPFFHVTKLPLLAGTHIKYIRSSKSGIIESEFIICPEKSLCGLEYRVTR